jgi:AraC-like DNA-binding protein
MIETLRGLHETVHFKDDFGGVRLYRNRECEDYPNHWHVPLEVVLPLRGGYRAECGPLSFELQDGDLLLINSGTVHRLFAPPSGERLIFQADISFMHVLTSLRSSLSLLPPAVALTPATTPSVHGELRAAMLAIEREYFGCGSLREASIYAILLNMLVSICRARVSLTAGSGETSGKYRESLEKILSVCDTIDERCAETLTLDQAAEWAGYSKYHFTRLFRQFTGVSFYQYVSARRIASAERCLIDPEVTILDAAMLSGFSSPSAFIRMFKLHKGCTPSEFRALHRK